MLIGVDASKTSRVIQGVSAAVRFLGAAAILKSSTDAKEQVEGPTTAAGIWFTTAIGVAVGAGKEFTTLIGTVVALIVLTAVPLLTRDKKSLLNTPIRKNRFKRPATSRPLCSKNLRGMRSSQRQTIGDRRVVDRV